MQNHGNVPFSDVGEGSLPGSDVSTEHESIPDDLKDSLCVLKDWGMFVQNSSVQPSSDIGLLTDDWAKKKAEFFSHCSGDIALGRIATTLSNGGWTVENGNYTYYGRDMGCPLMHRNHNEESEFLLPLMHESGGFHSYHAHILPALMINRLLSIVSTFKKNKVKTYVMCHGNGILPRSEWWSTSMGDYDNKQEKSRRVAGLIFSSRHFQTIFQQMFNSPVYGKSVNRLCIWVGMPGHVFCIVWDVKYEGNGIISSQCYPIDNLEDNLFRDLLVDEFVLQVMSTKHASTHKLEIEIVGITRPLISRDDIPVAKDMACVSFMTRATLYLSMVNQIGDHWMVKHFHEKVGIIQERYAFEKFTNALLNFVEQTYKENKMIWISPINSPFVDIDRIYLMKIDPSNAHLRTGKDKYIYQGSKSGFTISKAVSDYKCSLMSQYTSSPLDIIRDCRSILQQLRLRGRSR